MNKEMIDKINKEIIDKIIVDEGYSMQDIGYVNGYDENFIIVHTIKENVQPKVSWKQFDEFLGNVSFDDFVSYVNENAKLK